MLYSWLCAITALLLLSPAVHPYKFAVLTSPTLGNFRDLSGLVNGLLNFRHEVYLLSADDNRTNPEFAGLSRMQLLPYRTSGENPFDEQKRFELIYGQQESLLRQFDQEIGSYECGEALDQLPELVEQIKQNQIHMIVVDAEHKCYYQIADEFNLPIISLASKSEPYLMQTHALTSEPCYVQDSNSILSRIKAFWSYLRYDSSPALRSALWLWNTNGVVDCPGPTTTNVLQVGGLSHKEEQRLPEELDTLCNNAKYGVIVFSLPGIRYSSAELMDKFLDAFEQLDQLVILRTDANIDRRLPRNVLTTFLISENDLLAHVNVKLMITDASNARQLDALFHGVPLISVPLTSSQRYDADRLRIKGHGAALSLDFTSDQLIDLVTNLLNDVNITETAKRASSLLKGSPDYRYIAVYWLDLIARYGASHLKPLELSTIQFYMIDVVFVVTSVTLLIAYVLSSLVKVVVKMILTNHHKPVKTVVLKEGMITKPKPAKLELLDLKPKEQKQSEKKVETPTESPPEKSTVNPTLQQQGSKKQKKKKNK